VDIAVLAALAGNAVVTAAVTDAWEDVRLKIASIFGRGRTDPQIDRFGAAPAGRAAVTRAARRFRRGWC
jgi:hypothetical protein